jgi:hypothetical protein
VDGDGDLAEWDFGGAGAAADAAADGEGVDAAEAVLEPAGSQVGLVDVEADVVGFAADAPMPEGVFPNQRAKLLMGQARGAVARIVT